MSRKYAGMGSLAALVVAVPVLVGATSALAGTAPRPVGKTGGHMAATAPTTSSPKTADSPAVALKGYQIVQSATLTDTAGEQSEGDVSCPSGYELVGGGAVVYGTSINQNVNASYPNGATWYAFVSNADASDGDFSVYADCVEQVRNYQVITASFDNPAGSQTEAAATCPTSTVVLGGGGYGSSLSTAVNLNGSFPYDGGWRVDVNNASGDDDTADVYAICGASPTNYSVQVGSSANVRKGKQAHAVVACPARTHVLSGGGYSNSGSTAVDLNSSAPYKSGWIAYENNGSTSTTAVTAYAICAKTTTST